MSNYERALEAAIDRDIRDEERLEHFVDVLTRALDAIAHDVHPMEHPDAKWHPGDLVDTLQGELVSIRAEQKRLTSGLVVL